MIIIFKTIKNLWVAHNSRIQNIKIFFNQI